MTHAKTLSHILDAKIVAIIRGANPSDALAIANALYDGGITVLEITMNSPKPLAIIEELSKKMEEKMLIGAGTVLDAETARLAILAGAKFILSPTVNVETITMTKRYGAVSIPGAFTPTEILTAYEKGGDIIKVFPGILGYSYIKEIQGPLPHIPLLPTGGIRIDNIQDYIKAGAAGFGIGTSLVDTKQRITEDYLLKITEKAQHLVRAVHELP